MAELALVTGGETGIGKAIADALRAEGFDVRSASRRSGHDLTDRDAIRTLVASLPRLDVLVNNAGTAESAPVHRASDDHWDRHLALNATAPFLLVRAALPALKKAPRGRIVNVASTAALRGSPYVAAYAASKHALLGFARCLAAEVDDVAVHCVCPGYVDSPLTDRTVANIVALTGRPEDEVRGEIAAQNPCGRLIRPEEVAQAVVELIRADDSGRELVLE